jgi:hypothetical protein
MDMRMLLHKMQQLALNKRCHLAFLAYFFDIWFVHSLCTWLFQDVLLFRLESVQDIMLQTASRRRSRYLLLAFSPASVRYLSFGLQRRFIIRVVGRLPRTFSPPPAAMDVRAYSLVGLLLT